MVFLRFFDFFLQFKKNNIKNHQKSSLFDLRKNSIAYKEEEFFD